MGHKNKCKESGFLTILCAVAAILLCAAPSLQAGETIPDDGSVYNIPGDYGPFVSESLMVNGIVNLLPDADIEWFVYANSNSVVKITGGTVGWWIDVAVGADVTVYGTGFNLGEGTHYIDFGAVTGFYENGDSITLEFDCQPGATVTLAAPGGGSPEQLLSDLGIYILDQVDQYQEPIPPDIELIGIAPKLEVSLLSKVNAALAALEKGNPNNTKVVMNKMKALVNQVSAQTDKKVSEEAGEVIIGSATAIADSLGNL